MENLSLETLDTICEALSERSRGTSEASRNALTMSMRKAAEEDMGKTHKAWEEVEKLRQKIKDQQKNETKA